MKGLKQKLGQAYTIYGVIIFFLVLIAIFPFFWLVLNIKPLEKYGYSLYKVWGTSLHWLIGMPINRIYKGSFDKNKQYIFTPNHSSFLDITAVGSGPFNVTFLGKIELAKAPLFGYIYKRFNVIVDRKSSVSRKKAVEDCYKLLEEGKSLAVFPEGTISRKAPELMPFKDGAFLMAIEKQVPVVPVTLPFNWHILNGDGRFIMKWHKLRVVFHEPIDTCGMTKDDIPMLKEKVRSIIEKELDEQLEEAQIGKLTTTC
ncbi:MAG: 1-acyl-sn-glycerol-3-phosphate acyltransferase [Cytophagales bacterium]|nr:1-acyl-sn-glycerol-3-phosphate acyltransferase [Cytophagales bacterium]